MTDGQVARDDSGSTAAPNAAAAEAEAAAVALAAAEAAGGWQEAEAIAAAEAEAAAPAASDSGAEGPPSLVSIEDEASRALGLTIQV